MLKDLFDGLLSIFVILSIAFLVFHFPIEYTFYEVQNCLIQGV